MARIMRRILVLLILAAGTTATTESLFTEHAVRSGISPDSQYCVVLDLPRVEATNQWRYLVGRLDDQGGVTEVVDTIHTAAHLSWCDDATLFRIEHSINGDNLFDIQSPCTHLITYDVAGRTADTVASLCHDGARDAYGSFSKQAFRLRDSVFCFQTYRANHRWLSVVARVTGAGELDTLQTYANASMPIFCTGMNNVAVGVRSDQPLWADHQGIVVLEPSTGKERYRAIHRDLSLVEPVIRRNDGRLYCRVIDSVGQSRGIVCYDHRVVAMDTLWWNASNALVESWFLDGDSLRVNLGGGATPAERPQRVSIGLD